MRKGGGIGIYSIFDTIGLADLVLSSMGLSGRLYELNAWMFGYECFFFAVSLAGKKWLVLFSEKAFNYSTYSIQNVLALLHCQTLISRQINSESFPSFPSSVPSTRPRRLSSLSSLSIRERSRFPVVSHIRHLARLGHSPALRAWLFDNMDKSHTAWVRAGIASLRRMQDIPTCRQDVFAIGGRTLQSRVRGPSKTQCASASP